MKRGDIVEIIYLDRKGQFSQRRIRILEVGTIFVRAYCYNRKQIRVFQKDGILASKQIKSA
ncbi:hypothetical protein [Sporolactobacillus sp. KGMB 08714]|uniref:hypothetical protein n=1 Tax=Sporolactobacillus sp. KGMB 08714 TaxID=3064704 RepID=UPI002FBD36EB